MRKKIFYLIVVLLLFVLNIDNVYAVTAVKSENRIGNGYTFLKHLDFGNGDIRLSYCSNKSKKAPPNGGSMEKVSGWTSSTICSNVYENNVDCSIMIGYILDIAHDYASQKSDNTKYIFSQKAVQTYLLEYGDSWGHSNESYYSSYVTKDGKKYTVADVIKAASDSYKIYKEELNKVPDNWVNLNNPEIVAESVYTNSGMKSDWNMYYSDGYYRSYAINVKANKPTCNNGDTCTFSLVLTTNRAGVRICNSPDADFNSCSSQYTTNGDATVYLITQDTGEVVLNANSSVVQLKSSTQVSYMDSEMYQYVKDKKGKSYQKVVVLINNVDTKTGISKTFTKSASASFVVNEVKRGSCNSLYNGYSTASTLKEDGVVCENNKSDTNIKTDAKFASCNVKTHTINLTDKNVYYKDSSNLCKKIDGSVSTQIAVGQVGEFHFGELVGDTDPIIRGQGFRLSNVYYNNYISWKYALTYGSGEDLVYFTLPNKNFVHHDSLIYSDASCFYSTGSTFDDYFKQMTSKLKISSNSNLEMISKQFFKTYVDNVYTEDNDELEVVPVIFEYNKNISDLFKGKNIEILENLDSSILSNKLYGSSYIFKAPVAFFEIENNDVVYASFDSDINIYNGDNNYKNAGNRYYTLLKYVGDKFPFDVNNNVNVSFVDGMIWNIDASCDVSICSDEECPPIIMCEDSKCVFNYDYRSIDLDNPFPKWVASNWTNKFDQKRLNKNIFNKTPDYTVVLNSSNLVKVNKYNSSKYPVFNNINDDGSSIFVSDVFKGNINVVKGKNYCALGEFSSECDMQR